MEQRPQIAKRGGAAKPSRPSIVRWRGLLAGSDRHVRAMAFAVLVIASIAMSFTQLGFVGIGEQGAYDAYMVAILAPISLGALLLGVWLGTLLGLVSGGALLLHASFQPLDYYEVYFVTPLSSVAMLTVTAFFTGLLLAVALRKDPPSPRRAVYIVIVCVVCSVAFSISFTLNVLVELVTALVSAAVEAGGELDGAEMAVFARPIVSQIGSPDIQAVCDAFAMSAACLAGDAIVRWAAARKGTFALRTTFRAWLLLMLGTAWVIVASLSFVAITEQAKSDAADDMREGISYLLVQLGDRAGSAGEILDGYANASRSIIVVFSGDEIAASNDPAFEPGVKVAGLFDADGALTTMEIGEFEAGKLYQALYNENLVTLEDVRSLDDLSADSISTQVVFRCYGAGNGYTVMMQMPADKVFAGRNVTMAWATLSAFVLIAVVFVLTSRLLGSTVVRRIEETNRALGKITGGDLAVRADVRDNPEFASLTDGINSTVDALQGWIAEAASRMDAELATAKAIQESALPQVFPPFPDISRFDIYATMDAAKEVGGDFYDFFLMGGPGADAGRLGFVMADVSGKGVPAALFMMKAKTQIRDYLEAGMELGEAVENANRQLVDGNDAGMFVTVWVGVLDYDTGHVEFVNAGHNPPLLWQFESGGSGKWRWLTEKSGMPLGLFDGFPYETFSLDCRPGDTFLLYTDGVTEAMSASGELYGEDRLERLACASTAMHPRGLVRAVRASVADHAEGAVQSDDITILALEVGVPPEEKAQLTVLADVAELDCVNEFIHAELDRRLCPVRAQKQLDIAVEELFVNSCKYAYEGMPAGVARTVRVTQAISADPPSVTVEIIDSGMPYDPLAKPDAATADEYASVADIPIGGLGILMAKNSVDDMRYERIDGMNVVTLVKRW